MTKIAKPAVPIHDEDATIEARRWVAGALRLERLMGELRSRTPVEDGGTC